MLAGRFEYFLLREVPFTEFNLLYRAARPWVMQLLCYLALHVRSGQASGNGNRPRYAKSPSSALQPGSSPPAVTRARFLYCGVPRSFTSISQLSASIP